jgi:CP family cyanate transporter-like MFS transporter
LLAAGTVAFSMVGFVGLLVAPVSHATTWAVLLGVGQGASIAVAMTLIVLRSPDAGTAGRLSGMSQGIGYLLAAAGPLLVGAMRDISGGWQVPLLLLAILTIPGMLAGWVAGHPVMAGTLPSRIPRARVRPSRRRN